MTHFPPPIPSAEDRIALSDVTMRKLSEFRHPERVRTKPHVFKTKYGWSMFPADTAFMRGRHRMDCIKLNVEARIFVALLNQESMS